MEVTKLNFNELFENISSCLEKADFISIDQEFSGIGRKGDNRFNEVDTPEERYQKVRNEVQAYGMIQIGLSIFRKCFKKKTYYTSTYCFYVSGPAKSTYKYDTASMCFLAENGFNFNKLFSEGMSILTVLEEDRRREQKKHNIDESPTFSPMKLKEDAQKFVDSSIENLKLTKEKHQSYIFEGRVLNSFYRKLIFQYIAPQFSASLFTQCSSSDRNIEVLHFDGLAEKKQYEDERWEKNLLDEVGFGRIARKILEVNKPIVGHNILLDLLHFIDKLVAPLPSSYEEFKLLVQQHMPTVYDTKLIARDPPFCGKLTSTALGPLYGELTSKSYELPEILVEEGCQSYTIANSEGKAHNAGYDAFMTGVCFFSMLKKFDDKKWFKRCPLESKSLQKYANKLYVMHTYDMPYLDLSNAEVIPDRSHIFVVNCPPTCSISDIKKCFQPALRFYRVAWVNDTKCFVIPTDPLLQKSPVALKKILMLTPSNVKVSMYEMPQSGPLLSSTESHSIRTPTSKHALEDDKGSLVDSANSCDIRDLKRIKSVGSSQLSNMSLESPMEEDAAKAV